MATIEHMKLDRKKVIDWFRSNMKTHDDWTGTYVEYQEKCETVDDFIYKFLNEVED